jgi:hypothetical protein
MTPREFFIAGVQFQNPGLMSCIRKIEVGQELDLEPDPENKFDPNATKIILVNEDSKVTMLGYLPKQYSAEIAGFLTLDMILKCTVIGLNPNAKPWEMCKVRIEEEEL